MGYFFLGILGGIALSLFFSFGPAFFSQIQESIHYGFRNAVPFAFGVSTSDIMVVLILFFISRYITIDSMMALLANRWVVVCGAAVVAGFGFYTMFLKTKLASEAGEYENVNCRRYEQPSRVAVYLRGLMLNFFNPGIWLYWATLVAILIYGEEDIAMVSRYLFFGGVLFATLGMDVLKCKLASLLQRIITYKFLKIFNKTVGIVLVGFAIFMVVSTLPRFEDNSNQRSVEMMQEIIHTKPTLKLIGE